jgi:exopolysaccharide biosynthesis polyprenyl glycosylphosphotransferase
MKALIEAILAQKIRRSNQHFSRPLQKRLYVLGLLFWDILFLSLAFGLAYVLRFHGFLDIFWKDVTPNATSYLTLSLALLPVWLVLFAIYRLYSWQTLLGGLQEYTSIFNASVVGAVLIAVVQFFSEQFFIARGWVALVWVLALLMILVGRFIYRRFGYALRRQGFLTSPTLILGVNGEGKLLGEQLLQWPSSGLNLLGYLDDELPVGMRITGGLFVLGKLDELDDFIRKYQVVELVITSSAIPRTTVLEIFSRYGVSQEIQLRMSSGLFDILNTGLHVKEMGYVPLIGVNHVRLSTGETFVKRLFDIFFSLAGLIILSPFFLILTIWIRLDSPGPAFYRRRVLGINGRQFDAFKFRSMRVDGDQILAAHPELQAELSANYKLKHDPRITRLGGFLRKFSIDELPQLFNVLRGEMSLVGPRMITPPELKEYGQWGMNLLTVRPGLTGLWQVSGRSDVKYEERTRLDMFYIRNYTIWFDIQLVLRTIPAILSRKGAY